jgi:hypothetical protein
MHHYEDNLCQRPKKCCHVSAVCIFLTSHIVSSADRFAANGQLSPNMLLKDQLFIILSNAFDLCLNLSTGMSTTVRFFLFMNFIFLSLFVAFPI